MGTIPRYSENGIFLIFMWNKLSRSSLVHISSNCAPNVAVLLAFWSANRALFTVPCTFCRQLSQIEVGTRGNRDSALGFAPESVFTFHPWIHAVRNCYISQLLDDDDDDDDGDADDDDDDDDADADGDADAGAVVDMMVGMRQSSVTRKFSNQISFD